MFMSGLIMSVFKCVLLSSRQNGVSARSASKYGILFNSFWIDFNGHRIRCCYTAFAHCALQYSCISCSWSYGSTPELDLVCTSTPFVQGAEKVRNGVLQARRSGISTLPALIVAGLGSNEA